ncbi:MAG: hypothetical protein J6Q28_06215 [Alistipes sp.]|nr:hypothetical protein [Alistipes sp.]
MRKALLVLALLFTVSATQAQYNEQVARADYAQAFTGRLNNFVWSRQCLTDKDKNTLIALIAQRIQITAIVDNIIIGVIEDWTPGIFASMAYGRLPWDGSTIKAGVTYMLSDSGYIVTASRIYYLNEALDKSYSPVYSIIYNKYGELRQRGDEDLQYFDNAFCDKLLIE